MNLTTVIATLVLEMDISESKIRGTIRTLEDWGFKTSYCKTTMKGRLCSHTIYTSASPDLYEKYFNWNVKALKPNMPSPLELKHIRRVIIENPSASNLPKPGTYEVPTYSQHPLRKLSKQQAMEDLKALIEMSKE